MVIAAIIHLRKITGGREVRISFGAHPGTAGAPATFPRTIRVRANMPGAAPLSGVDCSEYQYTGCARGLSIEGAGRVLFSPDAMLEWKAVTRAQRSTSADL